MNLSKFSRKAQEVGRTVIIFVIIILIAAFALLIIYGKINLQMGFFADKLLK